jgi:hypothetical protein
VTGYTGYSDDPYEQDGYYLALHITSPGNDNIKVRSNTTDPDPEIGDTHKVANLDSDGVVIIGIANVAGAVVTTQTIDVIVCDNNDQPILTKTYRINCESSGEPTV